MGLLFETDGSVTSRGTTWVERLPRTGDVQRGTVFQIRNSESRYLTHQFHKFAGKFIPEIPAWAIERYLPNRHDAVVVDPFSGSGTTLVEACIHGHRSFGIDVDPLARLITKVKTTRIPDAMLRATVDDLVHRIPDTPVAPQFAPKIDTLSHWFTAEATADLSAIRSCIEDYRSQKDLYDFLLICFSSIIRRVSNADNQTMKTYVSHTYRKTPEDARPLFLKTLIDYASRLQKFAQLAPPSAKAAVVSCDDARKIEAYWNRERLPKIDLAITSPPYIKTVDYVYNQMAELFWIGERWGLETQKQQNEFKKRYVGHDRIAAKDAAASPITGIELVDKHVTAVYNLDKKLGTAMARYFRDMSQHLDQMLPILKSGAHYVMVVGDSTLAGYEVPTHELVASLAVARGFTVAYEFGYEVRNKYMRFPRGGRGGVVAHDWVVDLVAGPGHE